MNSKGTNWEYYEVENLVKRKRENGKNYYLVKWINYDVTEATWEPEENIEPNIVANFEKNAEAKKDRPKKTKQQVLKSVSKKPIVVRVIEEPKVRKQLKRDREEENKEKESVPGEQKAEGKFEYDIKKQLMRDREEENKEKESVPEEEKAQEIPKPVAKVRSRARRQEADVRVVGVKNGSLIWKITKDGEIKEMSTEDAKNIASDEMLNYFVRRTVLTIESS